MRVFEGGFNTYGFSLGILMLDARFPRVPGDLGNATTFSYPVILHVIPNATPRRVIDGDRSFLDAFIAGARELERRGVKAITTNCGFLAVFQKEMSAAVQIPMFTSSLIQVPLVHAMLGPGKRIGIITADSSRLTEAHFTGVGWRSTDIPIAVQGLESYPNFREAILNNGLTLDYDAVTAELQHAASKLVQENPDIGAIVFEGTLAQYAAEVQEVTRLPVFDVLTLANMVYAAFNRLPSVPPTLRRV